MDILQFTGLVIPITDLVARLLEKFRLIVSDGSVTLTIKEKAGLDERIKKIDQAKNNLLDSLQAIDELKVEAEANKLELTRVLAQLDRLDREKISLQRELDEIRNIAHTDVNIFRKVAGIPSKSDVNRERIIGFISGVISSIVASAIFFLLSKIAGIVIPQL